MSSHKDIYEKLHPIYERRRKKYNRNIDSKQMCLMWSTSKPPSIIEGSKPFIDIEDTFDIEISDDECYQLYDMTLEEASEKLSSLIELQC